MFSFQHVLINLSYSYICFSNEDTMIKILMLKISGTDIYYVYLFFLMKVLPLTYM